MSRTEQNEALRMIRQRGVVHQMTTTVATLSTSLCWRPSHTRKVIDSLIADGLVYEVWGEIKLSSKGLDAL